MMTPEVSVVIPTHNRRALLKRTLRSALEQRETDIEVIVVDDGSSDGTYEFLQQWGDPRLRVLRHDTPTGVSAARNTGLSHALGNWVAFLDDDDLWAPDKLATQLRSFREHPDAAWVSSEAVVVDEQLHVVGMHRHPTPLPGETELLAYNYIPGGGSGTMVRTELARSVGGFDQNLSNMADWDLWIRLSLQAPLAMVHRPLVAYLRHSGGMSRNASGVEREFEWITSKYADVRAPLGIRINGKTLKWFARRQVRAGNRLSAARLYAHAAWHDSDLKSWGLAAASIMSPQLLNRRRAWDPRKHVQSDFIKEAEAWLKPLQQPASQPPRSGRAVT